MCYNCAKRGHFARDCRQKKVQELTVGEPEAEQEQSGVPAEVGVMELMTFEEAWLFALEEGAEQEAVSTRGAEIAIDSAAETHACAPSA